LSIPKGDSTKRREKRSQNQRTPPRLAADGRIEEEQLPVPADSSGGSIVVEPVYESEPLLKWKDFDHKCPSIDTLSLNFKKELSDRLRYVDLRPYMNPTPFTINALAPLNRAFKLFRHQGLRHLVVINDAHDVVGVISRSDLVHSHLEKVYSSTSRIKRWNSVREGSFFD
jgi:CBS domain-containing protein